MRTIKTGNWMYKRRNMAKYDAFKFEFSARIENQKRFLKANFLRRKIFIFSAQTEFELKNQKLNISKK